MLDPGPKVLLEYCEVGRSSKDLLRSISPFPDPLGNLSVSSRSLVMCRTADAASVTGGAGAGPDSGSAGSRMDGKSELEG
jgi:hypothetical protein